MPRDLILPQFHLDQADPVNWSHPLNAGRLAWYLCLRHLSAGVSWYNLVSSANGTLTSMAAGTGWADTVRPGGFAAIHFSGSAGYIPLGSDPSYNVPGDLTVAAWVRTSSIANAGAYILQAYDTSTPFHGFALAANGAVSNGNKFSWWNGASWTDSTTVINDGKWHRLLIATTGTTVKFYLDGVLDKSATPASPSLSFSGTRTIGAINGGGSARWNGDIDDVTLWSRFFTPADVWADYTLSYQGYPGVINRLVPILALQSTLPSATAITLTGPSSGYAGKPSTNFTVSSDGAVTGTVVVTPSDGGAGGTFTPSSVNVLFSGSATFTYRPALTRSTPVTISVTNNGGLTNPAPITYTVSLPTLALSPNTLVAAQSGLTVVVTGTGSIWNTNAPTFTLTGLSGSSITLQVVNSDTQVTLTLTTGTIFGTATVTETLQSETSSLVIGAATTWCEPANFGAANTGLTGTIGYAITNPDGSVYTARTTAGIVEYPNGSGVYWPGTLTFYAGFRGGVIWDTGGATPKYAAAALNLTSNDTAGRTQVQAGTQTGQVSLTAGVAAANIAQVNSHAVTGDGHKGTEWGPA